MMNLFTVITFAAGWWFAGKKCPRRTRSNTAF